MPRKSTASLSVVAIDSKNARLQPPKDMSAPAKQLWVEIVNSLPGDRFHVSDGPLLSLYCSALARAAEAMKQLETAADPQWLKFADTHAKLAATLSTKLRLNPQARLDRKVAGPAARDDHSGEKPWDN